MIATRIQDLETALKQLQDREKEFDQLNVALSKFSCIEMTSPQFLVTMKSLTEGRRALKSGQYKQAAIFLQTGLLDWITAHTDGTLIDCKDKTPEKINDQIVRVGQIICIADLSEKSSTLFFELIKAYLETFVQPSTTDLSTLLLSHYSCLDFMDIAEILLRRRPDKQDELTALQEKKKNLKFLRDICDENLTAASEALQQDKKLANNTFNGIPLFCLLILQKKSQQMEELIKLFIDADVNVAAKDEAGTPALFNAMKGKNYFAMELMLKKNLAIANESGTIKNSEFEVLSPLEYAVRRHDPIAARLLRKYGAKENGLEQKFDQMSIAAPTKRALLNTLRVSRSQPKPEPKKKYLSSSNPAVVHEFKDEPKSDSASSKKTKKKSSLSSWEQHFQTAEDFYADGHYAKAIISFHLALEQIKELQKATSKIDYLKHVYNIHRKLAECECRNKSYQQAKQHIKDAKEAESHLRLVVSVGSGKGDISDLIKLDALPSLSGLQFLSAVANQDINGMQKACNERDGSLYATINVRGENGWTPLMLVAKQVTEQDHDDHFKLLRHLVEITGVHLNARDENARTTLHHAVMRRQLRVINYLLARKEMNINSQDEEGRTALHYAAENGFSDIVDILLLHNANTEVMDSEDKTAIELTSHTEIKTLIAAHQAAKATKKQLAKKEEEKTAQEDSTNIVYEALDLLRNEIVPGSEQYYSKNHIFLKAEKALRAQYEKEPRNLKHVRALSEFYRRTENFVQQRHLAGKTLRYHKDNISLLLDVAFAAKRQGDYKYARIKFESIEELLQGSPAEGQVLRQRVAALIGRIKIYLIEKHFYHARVLCAEILKMQKDNAFAITTCATIYKLNGHADEAEKMIKQLPAGSIGKVRYYFHSKNYPAAIRECEQLAPNCEGHAKRKIRRECLLLLARSYENLWHLERDGTAKRNYQEKAKKAYLELVDFAPDFYDGKMSFLIFRSKMTDDRGMLEREYLALREKFACEHAYLQHARFLWYSKKYVQAIQVYEETARRYPESMQAHIELVESYLVCGKRSVNLAVQYCKNFFSKLEAKAIDDESDLLNVPDFYYTYISALLAANKVKVAKEIAQKCSAQFTHSEKVLAVINDMFSQYNLPPLSLPGHAVHEEKQPVAATPAVSAPITAMQELVQRCVSDPEKQWEQYFLTGNAKAFWEELVRQQLDRKLFPATNTIQPSADEQKKTNEWIAAQLGNIDERFSREGQHSALHLMNEVSFIITTKELVHVEEDFSAVYLETMGRYGFDAERIDFLAMRTHASLLMGYVYSRRNYSVCPEAAAPEMQQSRNYALS